MKSRHARIVARVLTLGIVACCCLTFFPRILFTNHAFSSPVLVQRAGGHEQKGDPTFAHAALEMKAFIAKNKQPGSSSASEVRRPMASNQSARHGNSRFITTVIGSDELPKSCLDTAKRPSYLNIKASIIISLVHLGVDDPVHLLSMILRHVPDHVTEDVIITAEEVMSNENKDRLESAVDLCAHCRLFFLKGTIYEHRNSATRFSREDILIFVDGRVIPEDGWIEPLLFELNFNHQAVVSPHLHLWDAKKGISDVSRSRLEMTWDLNVFRAPLTDLQKSLVENNQVTAVNQTSVLKEVLAIRRSFFLELGLFDLIPGASGGEHASFSLKVMNCGGEIYMAVCSRVFLDVSLRSKSRGKQSSEETFFARDYYSPSFSQPIFNATVYYDANSKIWLDSYAKAFYIASFHRQVNYSAMSNRRMTSYSRNSFIYSKYGRHANSLKLNLMSMECEITNFRYLVAKFQPNMMSPVKRATHFGYIRSTDGMYAFGHHPDSSFAFSTSSSVLKANKGESVIKMKHSGAKYINKNRMEGNWLVFTRNSSLWVGPFSYIQGKLQYKRIWCVTLNNQLLDLQLCTKQNSNQIFLYNNGIFRLPSGGGKSCIAPEQPSERRSGSSHLEAVNKNLVLSTCDTQKSKSFSSQYFTMDMELLE